MISMADLWRRHDGFASFTEVDDQVPPFPRPTVIGYSLPELAGDLCPMPLMLWWALLIGLSSLARYRPAAWTAAIDLDQSALAVSLERVLDVATARLPWRIFQALTGGPHWSQVTSPLT
jgi:hypothetical protein